MSALPILLQSRQYWCLPGITQDHDNLNRLSDHTLLLLAVPSGFKSTRKQAIGTPGCVKLNKQAVCPEYSISYIMQTPTKAVMSALCDSFLVSLLRDI